MKNLFLIILTLSIIASCNSAEEQHESVSKQKIDVPFPDLKPKAGVFHIQAAKDTVITTERGSKIRIKANSFVTKEGEPIEGEVELSFAEYHDPADILLSGIPMTIQSEEGEMEYFQSAGMFDISAQSEETEEVRIAENSAIEVDIASNREEEDFNFYSFSEGAGNWQEQAQNIAPSINIDKEELKDEMGPDPVKPVEVKQAKSTDQVLDLTVDIDRYPEFSSFDNLLWKPQGEIANDDILTTSIRSPELTCVDVDKSEFELSGVVNGKLFKQNVIPVLFGKNFEKAQKAFKEKMKEYNKAVEEKEIEKKRLAKMGDFMRTARISNFGIYNFDRIIHKLDKVNFKPVFLIPALQKTFKKAFLLFSKDKAVIPYNDEFMPELMLSPSDPTKLVTIDEHGDVFEHDLKAFKKIPFKEVRKNKEFTFKMEDANINIADGDRFKAYLNDLD